MEFIAVDTSELRLAMFAQAIREAILMANELGLNIVQTHAIFVQYMEVGREMLLAAGITPDTIKEIETVMISFAKESNKENAKQMRANAKAFNPESKAAAERFVKEWLEEAKETVNKMNAKYKEEVK